MQFAELIYAYSVGEIYTLIRSQWLILGCERNLFDRHQIKNFKYFDKVRLFLQYSPTARQNCFAFSQSIIRFRETWQRILCDS